MVTTAQIKKVFPSANASLVAAIANNWSFAEQNGITTDVRKARFFGEIGAETGGLKSIEENLNYTTVSRIRAVWPSRFKSDAAAKPYLRQPQKLAIKVYGGRMGNKGAPSTDGWDFRGSGMLMTTGREGHRKMGFEKNPEALREPVTAFKTAVREWVNRACNELADRNDAKAVRRAINGGTNGLSDAAAYYKKARAVWPGNEKPTEVSPSAPVVIAATPAQPPAMTQKQVIEQVQAQLRGKGYYIVGDIDGLFANATRDAILSFQADNSLPLTGLVTDDLPGQIVKAPPRPISPARQNATEKDLKGEPIIWLGGWLKKLGTGILTASGLGVIAEGTGNLDDTILKLGKLRSLTETIMSFSPWLILGVLGGGGLYIGIRVVKYRLQAHREGSAF